MYAKICRTSKICHRILIIFKLPEQFLYILPQVRLKWNSILFQIYSACPYDPLYDHPMFSHSPLNLDMVFFYQCFWCNWYTELKYFCISWRLPLSSESLKTSLVRIYYFPLNICYNMLTMCFTHQQSNAIYVVEWYYFTPHILAIYSLESFICDRLILPFLIWSNEEKFYPLILDAVQKINLDLTWKWFPHCLDNSWGGRCMYNDLSF